MKKLICFFKGCILVPMLIETNNAIYSRGCIRCKRPTMFPVVWKHCPPRPGKTKEEWETIQEKYFEEVRNSIKREIESNGITITFQIPPK